MLATGGGLLFTGKETGEFIAIDPMTARPLEVPDRIRINAMPMTYTQNGRQYVTILSGVGGLGGTLRVATARNVPQGGSVWTFALID